MPCPECDGLGHVNRMRGVSQCKACLGTGVIAEPEKAAAEVKGQPCWYCGVPQPPAEKQSFAEAAAEVRESLAKIRDMLNALELGLRWLHDHSGDEYFRWIEKAEEHGWSHE